MDPMLSNSNNDDQEADLHSPRTLISTAHRDARLMDLPVSQNLADKWHAIAMSHLLIQSTTTYAAQDKPLDTPQLFQMIEGTSLFSMKFGQCPIPVDLLAVKSNSFCPPRPPDLDKNLLSKHLHYSLLDWKMTAQEEVDEFNSAAAAAAANASATTTAMMSMSTMMMANGEEKDNKNNNMNNTEQRNSPTSSSSYHHHHHHHGGGGSTVVIPWDKFFEEADEELTKLIENPTTYNFRHPESTSMKRAAPSFGVEGFASSVLWLCLIQQAIAESKQNKAANELSMSVHHRKNHQYDPEVGDMVWRQALLEALRPKQQQFTTTNGGTFGDAIATANRRRQHHREQQHDENKENEHDEKDEESNGSVLLLTPSSVSLSSISHRVGAHLTKDACLLLKLLISGERSESEYLFQKLSSIKKNNQGNRVLPFSSATYDQDGHKKHTTTSTKNSPLTADSNNPDLDSISIEDSMHLLCVKRISDLDDSLLSDLEKWCERRVALWLMERFSPLDFPSSVGGKNADPARKYFRPYLLRCFFKIVSTAVSRVITRLFNGTVTGGKVSQKEVWSKIRSKSSNSSSSTKTSAPRSLHHEIPPEVLHAKIVQSNVEKFLISLASLAPVTSTINTMSLALPSSSGNNNTARTKKGFFHHHHHHPRPPPQSSSTNTAAASSSARNSPLSYAAASSSSFSSSAKRNNNNKYYPSSSNNNNNTTLSMMSHHNDSDNLAGNNSPSSPLSVTTSNAVKPSKSLKQQMKDSIRLSLADRKSVTSTMHQHQQTKQFTDIILTDDEAAVRRDIAMRAAARKRTIALEEGDDLVLVADDENSTGQQQQQKQQNNHQQKRTRRPNRYVGWDIADKGIAIGDDSDYRKNLSTHSSTAMMLRNVRVVGGDGERKKRRRNKNEDEDSTSTSSSDDEDDEDDLDKNPSSLPEQSSKSIMASIAKIGHTSSTGSGGGGGGGIVSASFEAKLQQQRAVSARQATRSIIDSDRRALASHFRDLKHVVKDMDRARMQQLLQLQNNNSNGLLNDDSVNNTNNSPQQKKENLVAAAQANALSNTIDRHDENTNNNKENHNNKSSFSPASSPRHHSQNGLSKEAQLQAKAAAAAKVKEMQDNRPRTASSTKSTNHRLPIRGLSKCAEASLRDAEEIVGNVFTVRPPERTITLTPRGTNIRSLNLARSSIRKDLEGCLSRVENAERKTDAETQEQANEMIMTHFKRSLSNQNKADLERTVSVVADRVRAENARKKAEKNSERKWLIQSLRDEIRTKLFLTDKEIVKRCSTGMRTQEYYAALHSCKQKIDEELMQVLPVNNMSTSNTASSSSSHSCYEYSIKERNTLRDLAMVVHRLMCFVRRNYPEVVEEFEEFELRRKGRKNAAVKREAEYL